jgi:hypothetical protein
LRHRSPEDEVLDRTAGEAFNARNLQQFLLLRGAAVACDPSTVGCGSPIYSTTFRRGEQGHPDRSVSQVAFREQRHALISWPLD